MLHIFLCCGFEITLVRRKSALADSAAVTGCVIPNIAAPDRNACLSQHVRVFFSRPTFGETLDACRFGAPHFRDSLCLLGVTVQQIADRQLLLVQDR